MTEAPPNAGPARIDVGDWVLRCAVAVLFADVGAEKLLAGPESGWISMFAEIGFGDWFRYLTGWMQVVGALLLLIPRTALAGAALVGATMAGAIFCHLFLLDTGAGGAIVPAIFLGFVVAAASRRWRGRSVEALLDLGARGRS